MSEPHFLSGSYLAFRRLRPLSPHELFRSVCFSFLLRVFAFSRRIFPEFSLHRQRRRAGGRQGGEKGGEGGKEGGTVGGSGIPRVCKREWACSCASSAVCSATRSCLLVLSSLSTAPTVRDGIGTPA